MDFNNTIPEWQNEGAEPSNELKTGGFKGGDKPPATFMNWFISIISKAIKEIQNALSNVDNTADSDKNVKFASEAGVGRKVEYPFILRFKGGDTEGTDKFTFDGSASKSANITPANIGARPTEKPNIVVNAERTVTEEKEVYTATNNNITELYDGLEITIIPNATNETLQPRLNLNGIGDKAIRLALSFNCAATNALKANFIQANRPITLKYHANLNLGIQGQGAWIFADRLKVSAQDLYGSVPIESGGTGASTAAEALENLGVKNHISVSGDYFVNYYNNGANSYRFDVEKMANGTMYMSGRIPYAAMNNSSDGKYKYILLEWNITFAEPPRIFTNYSAASDFISTTNPPANTAAMLVTPQCAEIVGEKISDNDSNRFIDVFIIGKVATSEG